MRMKKEIIYLLEYLSKSEKNDEAMPYQEIVLALFILAGFFSFFS